MSTFHKSTKIKRYLLWPASLDATFHCTLIRPLRPGFYSSVINHPGQCPIQNCGVVCLSPKLSGIKSYTLECRKWKDEWMIVGEKFGGLLKGTFWVVFMWEIELAPTSILSLELLLTPSSLFQRQVLTHLRCCHPNRLLFANELLP